MLLHNILIAFIITFKIAFEEKPNDLSVHFELYMNTIFFIEMIRTFFTPYWDDKFQIYVVSLKLIAKRYMKSWFLLDIISFMPVTYFRSISVWEDGHKDDFLNFV